MKDRGKTRCQIRESSPQVVLVMSVSPNRSGNVSAHGTVRSALIAAGDREQRARMNERKLNEQQGGRDRADHEHCSELSEVGKRHRGKRHCRTEHGEQDEQVARANRFWMRLGGSVDSRTCCSSKTPLVGTSASAREPRWVPF